MAGCLPVQVNQQTLSKTLYKIEDLLYGKSYDTVISSGNRI